MSAVDIAAIIGFLVILYLFIRKPKQAPGALPPGPKPIPILGNLRDLTPKELWLPATEWAKQYGDVTYLHVLGQGIVFLNTAEVAVDLLDKRGAIYSDKMRMVMTGELCGCENMVAFTRYGEKSRRQRKLMHRAFGVQAVKKIHPLMEVETKPFLTRLVTDPSDFFGHIRRYAGGLTLLLNYGYEAKSNDDPMLALAENCVAILANEIASGGGIWPVDIFPSLQYLPSWMPGAGFKRKAAVWKTKMEEFVDVPYEYLKNSLRDGTAVPSLGSTLLEEDPKSLNAEKEFDIKWTANSMYAASIDTTVTAVSHFILTLVHHPEILAKAQEEIDRVVGNERLPTFTDRPSLPYLEAIMSETLRWSVPVPMSLPHSLMEDDIYNDMWIPKGSLIFANIWAICRDENIYPDAYSFKPERFLEKADEDLTKQRDPRNYVFGFGRRRCPGANLVESSVWLLMASMLATLNITKAVDEKGEVIEPEIVFENPIFRTPNKFKCDIKPRSEAALSLLRST